MPFEYGGQTWPDTPWVIRYRDVRLQHPTPDLIDGYQCQWQDGLVLTAMREGNVTLDPPASRTTGIYPSVDNIHSGQLYMHLIPGQPADGPVRCLAYRWEPRLVTRQQWNEWEEANPGKTPVMIKSDWSNSQPLGPVLPDPVPEIGLNLAIITGLLGLWFMSWRRRPR